MGIDNFRKIREQDNYFVDKTLMIKDFIEFNDEVTLITRPRRFGKTLNMTMVREFFDITKDSKEIFNELAIMETEYANLINSRPVIYFSFKDCKANTTADLLFLIAQEVRTEYGRYNKIMKDKLNDEDDVYFDFMETVKELRNKTIDSNILKLSIKVLERAVANYYNNNPILLVDEYDQPILSGHEYHYHDELKTFFSVFYGSALKGQDCLHQALLTGVQRVAKEGIFSGLNNVKVYTVTDERYSPHFGFTEEETETLLKSVDLELDESVKQMYDGYIMGKTEVYNPWSIISYAISKELRNYWINTSNNLLIKESINEADSLFRQDFDELIKNEIVSVSANLESSFSELKNNTSLWGLLINAGYATVTEKINASTVKVRIPNDEVKNEFLEIIAESAHVSSNDLRIMFDCLAESNITEFLSIYRKIILDYVSFHDVTENSYHMLFLGMCISANKLYKISSNIERGYGKPDILMESRFNNRPHIIIEFKKAGKDEKLEKLKDTALQQIVENQYYNGLIGEVLCLGIAHDVKRCEIAHKIIVCDQISEDSM